MDSSDRIDLEYTLQQLRWVLDRLPSTSAVTDCVQRAIDALERIEARANEVLAE